MFRSAVALLLLLPCGLFAEGRTQDVVLSFAVMGGCRMSTKDLIQQGSTNPSSANVPQLKRTLADLAGLRPVPSPFFCTGDIIDNLVPDAGQTLQSQLRAWKGLVAASPVWGHTELVVLPGNHETLMKRTVKPELPNLATYPVWSREFAGGGFNTSAGNGPLEGGLDRLSVDQNTTTFSYDRNGVHFVCVSTDSPTSEVDPATGSPYTGWIPINWIRDDIDRAQLNPAVRQIFMLGHKPTKQPQMAEEGDAIQSNLSEQLVQSFLSHSKFRAYLTGHEHLWDAHRLAGQGTPWEIIIGNGGSKLNKHWKQPGQHYFGFTIVNVYRDGRVGIVNYRRPCPESYFSEDTQPAKPDAEFFL